MILIRHYFSKPLFLLALIGLVCLAGIAQAAGTKRSTQAPAVKGLESSTWLLRSMGEFKRIEHTVDLSFKSKRVSGSDGCNRFTGAFDSTGPGQLQFKLSGMAVTMMACIGQADELSRLFHQMMADVRSYEVQGTALSLRDAHGKILAVYEQSATGILGTGWNLNSLNDGKQAIYSSSSLGRLELFFLQNGLFTGRVGCVAIHGIYMLDEPKNTLSFKQLKADTDDCHPSQNHKKNQIELLQALNKTTHYQRVGSSLELRSAEGAIQLIAHLKH